MIIKKNDITIILTKEEKETLQEAEKILNKIYNAMDCDSQYHCYDENDFVDGYVILRELTTDLMNCNQTITIKNLGEDY